MEKERSGLVVVDDFKYVPHLSSPAWWARGDELDGLLRILLMPGANKKGARSVAGWVKVLLRISRGSGPFGKTNVCEAGRR